MRTTAVHGVFILLPVLAGLVSFCSNNPDPISGSGTSTQSGIVTGSIINGITGKPEKDVAVTLIASDNIPSPDGMRKITAQSAATTDSLGAYRFESIPAGTYNLLAEKDTLRSFHDLLLVDSLGVNAGNDTLEPSGSIAGRVILNGQDDARTVMILAIGTTIFLVPKTREGDFFIPDLAPGCYAIRFLSTLDEYTPLDTAFCIPAGTHDTLENPILLPFKGIPAVTGVSVTWDSLLLKASITWNSPDTAMVSGYKVFRGIEGEPLPSNPINTFLVTGNSFIDSTCGPDSTWYYFVAAVGSEGQQSAYSNSDTIRSVCAYTYVKSIENISLGASYTQFAVRNAHLYWLNQSKVEIHDTSGALISSFGDTEASSRIFPASPKIYKDTFCIMLGDSSRKKVSSTITVQKFDLSGSFYGSESFTIGFSEFSATPVFGDFTTGDNGDLYYTTGNMVYRISTTGAIDSIPSPLSSQLRHPIQRMEYTGSFILYPMSIKNLTTGTVTTEIALLNPDLSLKHLYQNDWLVQGFSISPENELFMIAGNEIRVLDQDMQTLKKIPIPVSMYKDVEVDIDGTVYVYDYQNSRILIYTENK